MSEKKFKILIDDSNEPIGGKWSFDEENRKKIPNNTVVPQLEKERRSKHHRDIIGLIQNILQITTVVWRTHFVSS